MARSGDARVAAGDEDARPVQASPDRDHQGVTDMNGRPNIVLVHGAWADGSSWSAVIERLQAGGFQVTAPQFALGPLAADVARLRDVLSARTARRSSPGTPTEARSSPRSARMRRTSPGSSTSPRSRSTRASRSGRCWPRGRRRRRSSTCSRTPAATAGSQRTTSSSTSRPTSIRSGPGSCTPSSSRSRSRRSAR